MYANPAFLALANPDIDPVAFGRWNAQATIAFYEEMARLRAARNADDSPEPEQGSDDARVNEVIAGLVRANRNNAEYVDAAVKGLRGLGYTFVLSEPQDGEVTSRTYMRVLRPDGINAGYFNGKSFSFVGTKQLVKGEPNVLDGRYPRILWSAPGSVETVINVASSFLAG